MGCGTVGWMNRTFPGAGLPTQLQLSSLKHLGIMCGLVLGGSAQGTMLMVETDRELPTDVFVSSVIVSTFENWREVFFFRSLPVGGGGRGSPCTVVFSAFVPNVHPRSAACFHHTISSATMPWASSGGIRLVGAFMSDHASDRS